MPTAESNEYWDNLIGQYQRQANIEAHVSSEGIRPGPIIAPPKPGWSGVTEGLGEDDEINGRGSDDEDEIDDTANYVEYVSSNGQKVYYNKVSRAVRAQLDGEDLVGGEVGMNPADMEKTRRNSTILGTAWDADAPTSSATTAPAEEIEMSMEQVTDTVKLMAKNLSRIVETGGKNISPEAVEILTNLGAELSKIQANLEDGKQYTDDRTDVEALVDYKNLPWQFDNSSKVIRYRSDAAKRIPTHNQYEFSNWHLPQYQDNFPMPVGLRTASCVVYLPGSTGGAEVGTTRIQLNENDPTMIGIQQAFKRVAGSEDINQYCLKALGLNDCLLPQQPLFSYSYVRRCLRNRIEPKLSLIKFPQPLEKLNEDLKTVYAGHAKDEIQFLEENTYQDVSNVNATWFNILALPMAETHVPLRVRLCGVDNVDAVRLPRLNDSQFHSFFVEIFLFHGTSVLENSTFQTEPEPISSCPRWYVMFNLPRISSIPREARVAVQICGLSGSGKDQSTIKLAFAVHQLIDEEGKLSSGPVNLKMWGLPAKEKGKHGKKREDPDFIFRAPNMPNLSVTHPCSVRLDFDSFVVPIIAPLVEKWKEPNKAKLNREINVVGKANPALRLSKLETEDSLAEVSELDKRLLWQHREKFVKFPNLLPKFLQSVDWGNRDHKFEAHRMLWSWAPPTSMITVMELLDVKFADYVVRKYAVDYLRKLDDNELTMYLLQFTQTLKFEPYHDSPLSRFLIQRALQNPYIVGQPFFWHLKAELHATSFQERFGVLLEEYLSCSGRFARELRKQNNAVLKLQRIAAIIVRLKREENYGDDVATKEFHAELRKLNRSFFEPMGKFQIPLDPKWEATTLIVDKCRYMSSKMVPLFLVFNNADESAPPIIIMFKSGDDLRQDILTLQIITVMDNLWLSQGLDLRMLPYKVIATGVNHNKEGVGMIEIVLRSETTSGIQLKFGGGAAGALKMDPIDLYLQAHNKGVAYEQAVENFIHSCAGYCVATYVLGIGDRHNGNIMVTQDGHLFHIDFGHFLGNFKTKFGVKRERAAFVFTVEMAYVMGGKKYSKHPSFLKFKDLCSRAYEILRINANQLEVLFLLMVSAGMPELMVQKDIEYMKGMLHTDKTEQDAAKMLQSEIKKSLATTYRRFDNYIHNLKHG